MSVPATIRTWQFQVNQVLAPLGTTVLNNQAEMFAIKQSLKGAGSWTDSTGAAAVSSGNWVVTGSSDGVGGFGNNDGIDRWAASTNLIWAAAGVNHSWIVLEQAGIPGATNNFQLCIDLSNASQYNGTIVVSPDSTFAGGTATARPTAADERVLINNTTWGGVNGDGPQRLHVLKTSDGTSTRIVALRTSNAGSGGWTVLFWLFDLPIDTLSAWTNPTAALALGTSTQNPGAGIAIVGNLSNVANTWSRTPGGTNFQSTWTAEGTQQHAILTDSYGSVNGGQQNVCDVNNEAPLFSVGLYSTTVNARGPNGSLADIRLALENLGTANGRSYPGETTPYRQWAQFDDVTLPWNRALPEVLA